MVVAAQAGDGFAAGAAVLLDGLVDLGRFQGRVRGDFVESAEVVGAPVQEVRVRLQLVLLLQRGRQRLLSGRQVTAHHL